MKTCSRIAMFSMVALFLFANAHAAEAWGGKKGNCGSHGKYASVSDCGGAGPHARFDTNGDGTLSVLEKAKMRAAYKVWFGKDPEVCKTYGKCGKAGNCKTYAKCGKAAKCGKSGACDTYAKCGKVAKCKTYAKCGKVAKCKTYAKCRTYAKCGDSKCGKGGACACKPCRCN